MAAERWKADMKLGAERETGSAALKEGEKKLLRLIKMLIMLLKQVIKAKITQIQMMDRGKY